MQTSALEHLGNLARPQSFGPYVQGEWAVKEGFDATTTFSVNVARAGNTRVAPRIVAPARCMVGIFGVAASLLGLGVNSFRFSLDEDGTSSSRSFYHLAVRAHTIATVDVR